MAQRPESTSGGIAKQALAEELSKDAPARELSVVRFALGLSTLGAVTAAMMGTLIGVTNALMVSGLLAILACWYTFVFFRLRSGWFAPWLPWVNVLIEVSATPLISIVDTRFNGPEFALTAPPTVIAVAMVMLSGLRGNAAIPIFAGAAAAAWMLGTYFLLQYPRLPADAMLSLMPPFIVLRAILLFAAGGLSAFMGTYVRHKALLAMKVVRERDFLGKYLLHERLGQGGMAEVFRATYCPEGGFEREVALKRILPSAASDPAAMSRFRHEAAICSRLRHRNIVQVYDLGRHDGAYYLAMELVEGITLHDVIAARVRLPPEAVAYLAVELADALDYLHRVCAVDGEPLHLVHRDINPPNVLVSKFGEVKLADFGIARLKRAGVTSKDQVWGKVGYMAPEQIRAEALDGRADLFALGLTLHESLTGRRLFEKESELATMYANLEETVRRVALTRTDVGDKLDGIISELLEPDLSRRLGSARELKERLLGIEGDAAPYPRGQALLAEAVRAALVSRPVSPSDAPATEPAPSSTGRVTARERPPKARPSS